MKRRLDKNPAAIAVANVRERYCHFGFQTVFFDLLHRYSVNRVVASDGTL